MIIDHANKWIQVSINVTPSSVNIICLNFERL